MWYINPFVPNAPFFQPLKTEDLQYYSSTLTIYLILDFQVKIDQIIWKWQ